LKLLSKRGWHPQPIHGQPDGVLSGASSQMLVFFASFYRILVKRGWHPQPIHGQPDAVLSGASSQKLVFFASFYRILVKSEEIVLPEIFKLRDNTPIYRFFNGQEFKHV
jgi:hypothetical protein